MTQKNKANRLFLYGPLIFGVLLFVGWWGLWRTATQTILETVQGIIVEQEALGTKLSFDDFKAQGFPFLWRGTFSNFRAEKDGLHYHSDEIFIDALPYDLDRVIFSSRQTQTLKVGNDIIKLNAEKARASIEGDPEVAWLGKIESPQSNILLEKTNTSISTGAFLLNVKPEPRSNDGGDTVTDENSEAVREAPMNIATSFTISNIAVSYADNAFNIDDVEAVFSLKDILERERTKLVITGAGAAIGEARVLISGDLGTDFDGYLTGNLDTQIENPSALVAALAQAGVLNEQQAKTFTGVATFAAQKSGGTLSAPVILQNGKVKVMGFVVADAPRLVD
ncbi:MAG: DUF2125 domain-containing protein [Pseudomonadota bacterium]